MRHFVFLQGMPSPYFSRIARGLTNLGCRTTRINLCVGDWLFWRGTSAVNYRGHYADWPEFISGFFDRNGVTDLILLGEQRGYHKEAVAAAHARGIRVTVSDFGYLRPDWITLERDGMSGLSRFPREPQEIRRRALLAQQANLAPCYADGALQMVAADLLFNISTVLFWWLYPHYRRSDRRPHPLIYTATSGKHLLHTRLAQPHAHRLVSTLLTSKARYYLFPLQLEHDFQIVAYSPFKDMGCAIKTVLRSFARCADSDARLILKVHPWDAGLRNWNKLIHRWAGGLGIERRVDYLSGGNLDEVMRSSLGVVTVNSTSGIRALQLGIPVKALGQAIYDIPGLTYQGELDAFWSRATAPDPALLKAFIDLLAATVQVRGVFFKEPGLTAAVAESVRRLYDDKVGELT